MNMIGRPCMIKVWSKETNTREDKMGVFVGWGTEPEEFNNGVGNWTVGIIEMPDGTLVTVTPNNMKFLYPIRQDGVVE